MFAINRCSKKSSSLLIAPCTPRPPRRCVRYVFRAVLLIYPWCVIVKTTSSSAIISSMEKFVSIGTISVLLSSAYWSFIVRSSFFIISILWGLLSSIPLRWEMCLISSLYSSTTFSTSRPVSLWRRMSKIACDCTSLSLKPSIRPSFACVGSLLPFIISITLSILSSAVFKPSSMCALASASFKSNSVRLTTTSCLKSTK